VPVVCSFAVSLLSLAQGCTPGRFAASSGSSTCAECAYGTVSTTQRATAWCDLRFALLLWVAFVYLRVAAAAVCAPKGRVAAWSHRLLSERTDWNLRCSAMNCMG
jgi:hypothetical protein